MIITNRKLIALYLGAVVVCASYQVGIGADVWLVFALFSISLLAIIPLQRRTQDVADLFFFSVILYSATFPLVLKTILNQQVHSNLHAYDISSIVLLLGVVSVTIGYFVSSKVYSTRKRPLGLFPAFSDPEVAARIAMPIYLVGLATQILHTALRPKIDSVTQDVSDGFGGFGSFGFLVLLGIALQCCATFLSPAKRGAVFGLVLMLVGVGLLSIFGNVKKPMFDAFTVIVIFAYGARVRISIPAVVATALAGYVLLMVVSPLLHITRSASSTLGPFERFELALKTMDELNWDVSALNEKSDRYFAGFGSYRETGSYFYPSTANIDRFALILPIDQVSRTYSYTSPPSEPWVFKDVAQGVLPSLLIHKDGIASVDRIAWHYGIRPPGIVGRPVIGMTASVLAQFGIFGVILVPGIMTFLTFTFWNWLGGSMARNAWASFLLGYLAQAAESDLTAYTVMNLRDLLIVVIICMGINWVATRRTGNQGAVQGAYMGMGELSAISSWSHRRIAVWPPRGAN